MSSDPDRLVRVLREPEALLRYSEQDHDLLMRQAVRADLLTRVATLVDQRGWFDAIPPAFAAHLEGALRKQRAHRAEVAREFAFLRQALTGLDLPVVLLKGGAYVAAGLPPAQGRMFSDLDILVPRGRLPDVESALLLHGWISTHDSPYDQMYYRRWMHELPPLVHMRRNTALDVHHTISPLTSRWPVDGAALLANARPLAGTPGFAVLAPADMVLHSMLHLLLNEELSHGLRDLSDIDLLLRHFGTKPAFWLDLVERARGLGLLRPLYYGLRCASDVLGTPVPAAALAATRTAAHPLSSGLWLAAWRQALGTRYRSAADVGTPLAQFALYVRATWIRMPPLMLARHLWIKAWRLHEKPQRQAERVG